MGSKHRSRHLRRALVAIVATLALALVAAGCGGGAAGPGGAYTGSSSFAKPSDAQLKQDYEKQMEQLRTRLTDTKAPPLARSIQLGQRNELVSAAARWDEATTVAVNATPPSDIASLHQQMVDAMKTLGDYNRKIAAAAPNKARVQALANAAQNSTAAKAFTAAVSAIEAKGYHVMTPATAAQSTDPLAGASSPTG